MSEQEKKAGARGKGRSRVLYEITALVVVLMIASGLATFFIVNGAINRMMDKSVDKLIEEEAATIHAGLNYLAENESKAVLGDIKQYKTEDIIRMLTTSLEEKKLSPLMEKSVRMLQDLVEQGVMGVRLNIVVALPAPPVIPEATILLSDNENLIFGAVPPEVLAAIEEANSGGQDSVYFENGVPAFGLGGETLMSLFSMSQFDPMYRGFWGAHFVSMREAVADINAFYDSERKRASLILGLIVGCSVLLVILITFFVLNMLIRKQITAPIDELSAVAEQVMEGDLDVEIPIRHGEEFEGLKRAFKEMVESFRKYIAKSVGEE